MTDSFADTSFNVAITLLRDEPNASNHSNDQSFLEHSARHAER